MDGIGELRLAMSRRSWARRVIRVLPWAALVLVLLSALYLVINVEQETTQLSRHALWVFVSATIALLVLVAVIVGRLLRLRQRIRANEPGARLTARLVKIFIALALPPVIVLYLFSLEFLSETVEGWLDVQAEQALAQSIELGQLFLALRTREVRSELQRIGAVIDLSDQASLSDELLNYVSATGPTQINVLDRSGRAELSVHINPSEVVANLPNQFALTQALENGEYAAAEPTEQGLVIRVMQQITPVDLGATPVILQAIYPLPPDFSQMASDIEQAYYRYQNVSFLRGRLEQSLVLILSLVLLLTALLAIVLAFNAARRVSQPIRDLALATQELAAGRFPEKMPSDARDELGFLVDSFNTMTTELAQSRQALEAQRRYLEIVLSRLSAGVLAVDGLGCVNALNPSAADILGLVRDQDEGRSLFDLTTDHPHLAPLFDLVAVRLQAPSGEWRQEIQINEHANLGQQKAQPLVLVCRGSDLPGETGGHVVVFDDVTILDQAQREAAWAEVARRLAHEVKNPLTPIQLAAERLRYKLSGELSGEHAALLERATSTIGAQVEALRRLVDAFGDYAKPKPPRMEPVMLKAVILEVVDLYASGDQAIEFDLALDPSVSTQPIVADAGRLSQVLLNLIRNAQEAHPTDRPTIRIDLTPSDRLGGSVCWQVSDDGPGFSDEVLARAFEPYVTTKPGGTGLGLAIVKRIVEEHGGDIELANAQSQLLGGAVVRIWLPQHA